MKLRNLTVYSFVFLIIALGNYYAQDTLNNKDNKRKRKLIKELTYETQSGLPYSASKIYFLDSVKFALSGFAESNYIHYAGEKNYQSEDLELYMTNMQRFVMYAAYKPKPWLVMYAELFTEYMNDGRNESHFEFEPEIFLDFLIHPAFNARIGTHQATIGYLNNSDEPVMFYTVNRPEVERIVIPSTWIDLGVMTYGKINSNLKWSFSVFQGMDPEELNGSTWIRRGRSDALRFNFDGYTLNGSLKYEGIKNTELGLTGIFARMGTTQFDAYTSLVSPYVRNSFKNWSFMALGAVGRTTNTVGIYDLTRGTEEVSQGQVVGRDVYGYYAEVGYDLLPLLGWNKRKEKNKEDNLLIKGNEMKLPIFLRYERLDTHAAIDEKLSTLPVAQSDLSTVTVGLNFNPRRNIVLKTNYQFRNNRIALPNGYYEGNRFELGFGLIF